MRKITLNKFSDPAHGWIKISLKHLNQLNLIENITPFSYINNKHAYLEEDLDASRLLDRLEELNIPYSFNYYHAYGSSKIRLYDSYNINQAMKGLSCENHY